MFCYADFTRQIIKADDRKIAAYGVDRNARSTQFITALRFFTFTISPAISNLSAKIIKMREESKDGKMRR